MTISISGTVVLDESSGTQNAGSGSAGNNDIAGGAGILPSEFDAALTLLGVSSSTATGVAVSGATADNSTGTAIITGIPSDVTDVGFTDSTGAALAGVDSGLLTNDGKKIFLYTFSGDNNVLVGRVGTSGGLADPNGAIAFAVYLDTGTAGAGDAGATEAKVWMVQFLELFNPDATNPDDAVSPLQNLIYVSFSTLSTFSLKDAPAGQNLFLMYGTPGDGDSSNGDEVALVVTANNAASGGTVNSSLAAGTDTLGSNNQMLDPNEGLTFTFVTNATANYTVPNLDQNEADLEANIQFGGLKSANGASFKIVQLQPSSKAGTVQFEALNSSYVSGTGFLGTYATDSHVDILSVVVKNAAGTVIETNGDTDNDGLTITLTGGIAKVEGVKAGYTIEYTVDGTHNRVEIDNVGSTDRKFNAAFDVGNFQLSTTVQEPVAFNVLSFEDAGPSLDFGNLVGTGTTAAQTGYWTVDPGEGLDANGLDISVTSANLVRSDASTDALAVSFSEDSGSPDGSGNYSFSGTLTGDWDDDAGTADTAVNFTLVAYADGHYELAMDQPNGSSITLDTADGALRAGGPDAVQTLDIPKPPATPIASIVFFSAKATADPDVINNDFNLNETQLQNAAPSYVDFARGMNVSTSGIGVANNLLEGDADVAVSDVDESFVINPDILVSSMEIFVDNSVGGYAFTATGAKHELLYYTVYYDDGTFATHAVEEDLGLTVKGQPDSFVVDGGSKMIDAVQLTMAKGDVKIPHIVLTQETEIVASDVILNFLASVADLDGDPATSAFSASLYANDLNASFDFTLAGTPSEQDTFNVDLNSDLTTYKVTGWDAGDKLKLIGTTPTSVAIDNTGTDAVVTIQEAGGGQVTTVTVVGADLANADVV